jgi:DNA-binding beta-propeller fold protein YncE
VEDKDFQKIMKTTKRLKIIILLIISLIISSCASRWAVIYDTPQQEIQWPYPPKEPIVKHQKNIVGFKETESLTFKSIIHGREEILLQRPVAIAVGKDGRFAIADTECFCVHLFIPKEERYVIITKAQNVELNSPVGLTFDEDLRLYVSDSILKSVYVYDEKGDFIKSINRIDGYMLKRPTGLAYNLENKILYIVDTLEHRFYGINKEGRVLFFKGSRGTDDGEFNFPTHIFWSPTGVVYITDSMNFRIQAYDSMGRFLFRFGQHGNGSGDFAMPKGVAADRDGIIYVVDALFDNIQLFNERGDFLLPVGGRGSFYGEFWLPSGMFIDSKNNLLYVCDTFNKRVQIFQIMNKVVGIEK